LPSLSFEASYFSGNGSWIDRLGIRKRQFQSKRKIAL
jgi:hypothetical protein